MASLLTWAIRGGMTLAGITALSQSLFVVEAGHRAIMFDRLQGGTSDKVVDQGLHFQIPLLQYPIPYEIRTRYTNISSETGSKDLQTVGVNLRILFRPDKDMLPVIHRKLGPDYDERVLPSLGNEVLKAVVAQYDAGELITQRELVSGKIREALTTRAADFNIMLEDVSITHFSFSKEFSSAIENKQVAQQEAERSRFIVLKAEQEARAAMIRAQGEAEAARLIIDATNSGPGFIELRRIEGLKEIAETMSKTRNVTYIPQSANILLNTPQPGPPVPVNQHQ